MSAAIASPNSQTRHNSRPLAANVHQSTGQVMSVFEHQRLIASDFCVRSDFEWLITQELPVLTIKRDRGVWQLKVGHYIGVIMLPSGMALEILPKIPSAQQRRNNGHEYNEHNHAQYAQQESRRWVQRMLSDIISGGSTLPHRRHLSQLSRQTAPIELPAPSLSEWLSQQFLQSITTYQPSRHYQTQRRNESALQGKLLIKSQLRDNAHQPHKLACEVSVLSDEMSGNRLIKSALNLLIPVMSASANAAIRRILAVWHHIPTLTAHEYLRLPSIHAQAKRELAQLPLSLWQRRAASDVLEMAFWVLQSQHTAMPTGSTLSAQASAGSNLRLCLLIDMNQAFEQWASLCIAADFKRAKYQYQSVMQPRDVWLQDSDGRTCLSVQPDLLIYQHDTDKVNASDNASGHNKDGNRKSDHNTASSQCSHVIDIKWKHLPHAAAISASDAYQLTSYAQAYHAKQAWLVYPVTRSDCQPMALRAPHLDKQSVHHATLWLMPFNVCTGRLNITDVSAM